MKIPSARSSGSMGFGEISTSFSLKPPTKTQKRPYPPLWKDLQNPIHPALPRKTLKTHLEDISETAGDHRRFNGDGKEEERTHRENNHRATMGHQSYFTINSMSYKNSNNFTFV